MYDNTRDPLKPIDVDPLMSLGIPDPAEGYGGTAQDFSWALEMKNKAAHRRTERDRTEARECSEATTAFNRNDTTTRAASEILRKMQLAEDRGLAEWDGTNWRRKPGPKTTPPTEDREYPRFTESMVASRFSRVRKVGRDRWIACCPAHDDHNPSLSIARGTTHWLFTCWSHHCEWLAIVKAAGLDGFDFRIAD